MQVSSCSTSESVFENTTISVPLLATRQRWESRGRRGGVPVRGCLSLAVLDGAIGYLAQKARLGEHKTWGVEIPVLSENGTLSKTPFSTSMTNTKRRSLA